jgi:hypothetical protein
MGYQAHCVVMEEISRASGMRLYLFYVSFGPFNVPIIL